ncbi:efflux RND transporter periplasmic adaptor subunit [Barnesiella viscericola]|uniref:Efflux RND transporter periplasmic adaptor subunit n=1 Tax=Barnesiella viscericola TaxID=397865 RepID=A0A921MQ32_9BACT|nr:efflux RND transporter periplasmic adaptor subunit [Barnesiella viscericola]HJG88440.1 efflux RND transporter periplasmic adaptor subunit [Barnesiella viscericola]
MKKELLIGMAAACSALLFVACSGSKESTEQTEEETVQLVKVARVTEQAVPQVVSYTATIEPYKRNLISSSLPNRIKKIYVEVGDHVKAGQKLVDLDRANLAQQKLQLDNLELEYKRVQELFAVGGASQQQVDQMRTQYETAKTSYENLDENTVLVSPTNGVVTARNYDNGDLATGAILTVMQIQPVKVQVNVSESDFTKVKLGMPVDVNVEVYGDEVFKGKVSLIHPTIDASTRTFVTEINIPNADNRIRPGMFARVNIDFGSVNRVVVPDQAVVKRSGSGDRFVYVYKDGKVSFNQVQLGRHMDTSYELISGVENGAEVVIAGQSRLKDGAEVKVVE